MEKHFKKHIEDDQQQLLAEARGGGVGPMRSNAGSRNNAKGLLRVKLNNSNDRPATFSRVLAPGAGGISTQDRATSPFPINMMVRPGQNSNTNAASGAGTATTGASSPERMADTPASRIELASSHESSSQQAPPTTYLTHHGHHHHHQAAAAAAAASGPYQFVPFPHRPYHYDLLSLGSMGQSMYGGTAGTNNNKMVAEHVKYRDALGKHNWSIG